MSFSSLGLPATLIANAGFTAPTDVQQQAIPALLQGQDVMACAPTGTGKTAAFALPILAGLLAVEKAPAVSSPTVLVLTPTRELAIQVCDCFTTCAGDSGLRALAVFGGANIAVQRKAIAAGIDILAATPGRLFDLIGQGWLSLEQINQLVVDEADRMLDMGFVKDIQRVKRLLPLAHRTALFSATFTPAVRQLAFGLMTAPIQINVASDRQSGTIRQHGVLLDPRRKSEYLAEMIGRQNLSQVLVFAGSKMLAEQVFNELTLDGVRCAVFHGDKTQARRAKALEDFKSGAIRALVATDVAARGLDITALPLVVNFDLPQQAEDYIHRIGRTGRAGHSGEALSLLSPSERLALKEIEALQQQTIPVAVAPGYEPGAPLPARYEQHKSDSNASRRSNRDNRAKRSHNRDKGTEQRRTRDAGRTAKSRSGQPQRRSSERKATK